MSGKMFSQMGTLCQHHKHWQQRGLYTEVVNHWSDRYFITDPNILEAPTVCTVGHVGSSHSSLPLNKGPGRPVITKMVHYQHCCLPEHQAIGYSQKISCVKQANLLYLQPTGPASFSCVYAYKLPCGVICVRTQKAHTERGIEDGFIPVIPILVYHAERGAL